MGHTTDEIRSQQEMWRQAAELASASEPLWQDGERVAIVGCGTSWFVAQAIAALREQAGRGITDAVTATEFSPHRDYDRVVALSRSGTTTEIIEVLRALKGTGTPATLVTAVGEGPASPYVEREVVLGFADEESVVQTRFATSAIVFMRAQLEDTSAAIAAGITKVNVSTHLNKVATAATRAFLEENPTAVDPRKYLAPGTSAAAADMGRLLRLYSGA